MPRLARLDSPGVLHHIIVRGIERRAIFKDNRDRENFLERVSVLIPETKTICYAWVLMSNHAHFLLRSGPRGLSYLMRRLLTGHVLSYFGRKSVNARRIYSALAEANDNLERYYELRSRGYDLKTVEKRVMEIFNVDRDVIYSKGRRRVQVEARSLLCYWAVRELGYSATDLAKRLSRTQPAVGYAVNRGERIAKERKLNLGL